MGKCPTVPRLRAEAHPVQFWPRLPFLCNILSQCNIRSARMPFRSGTTGLFLLHTLARFEGPAAGAVPWALPAPQASFFCATFCNISTFQHSARPICPDASLIWGIIPFRVSKISKQAAGFFVRTFAHFAQSGSRRTLFLVRLFSAFLHPGSVLFFVRLFATFPDNRSAPVSVIATSGKMPRRGSCCR